MAQPRGQFLSDLVVRDAGDGRHVFLVQPFRYQMRNGRIMEVPVGFVSDYASIPQPFRMFLPRFGRYNRQAVLHDYAGRTDSVPLFTTSAEGDQLMKDSMDDAPKPASRAGRLNWAFTRALVNAGLKIGSRHFFHQHEVAWWPSGI